MDNTTDQSFPQKYYKTTNLHVAMAKKHIISFSKVIKEMQLLNFFKQCDRN